MAGQRRRDARTFWLFVGPFLISIAVQVDRTGGLAGAQQGVASTAQQMNGQLAELKQQLAPLVASWTGQAAVDYQAKQRQWDAAATDKTFP